MTELNFGERIQKGDVVVSGTFRYTVESVGEYAYARHKKVTLLLPLVYERSFKCEDEFGMTYTVYRD